jgi:hypothetical protein
MASERARLRASEAASVDAASDSASLSGVVDDAVVTGSPIGHADLRDTQTCVEAVAPGGLGVGTMRSVGRQIDDHQAHGFGFTTCTVVAPNRTRAS